MAFIRQFAIDLALLSFFTIPLIIVARNRGRDQLARKFLIAAGIVASISALIGSTSILLVRQCLQEANDGCADPGSSGMRMVVLGGYILVALGEAYLVHQD